MRPLAALCAGALGLALVHPGKASRFAFVVGLAVAAIAALGLALALFNIDLGVINRWLVPWAAVPGPGTALLRIVAAGATAFGLAGGSLALGCFEQHRPAATILGGTTGIIAVYALLGYLTGVDGRSSLAASARSELTGWETAVWAPKMLLEAPVRVQWRTLGATALLAIALVVALALWLGRIIARSVSHAARTAIVSGEGSLPLPSGTPVAEVNTLMAELRKRTDLLRESEAIFRAMFEVSSVGKIEVEPASGRVLRANAAMCEFVGYSEAELFARTVFDITHPDDRDGARELLRRMVAGQLAVFDVEKRYIRKDGNTVWARVTANIIRDQCGRPLRDTTVVQDITAHKEREEKEHLLMREINHRAKNMLSVVDSIAHQTATRNPKNFVERFSERIQALSANQDLLVRSDWGGVDIEDLVRAQLARFADLIGSRIIVDGPRLRLKPASAQAIGLALHEHAWFAM